MKGAQYMHTKLSTRTILEGNARVRGRTQEAMPTLSRYMRSRLGMMASELNSVEG